MTASVDGARQGRRLTWPWYLAVVIVYLGVIQGLGAVVRMDTGDGKFSSVEAVARNGLVPVGVSVLFVAGLVTWLGWWGEVLRYRVPVRRWVWFVPVSMLVVAFVCIDYPNLAQQGLGLTLCLVLFVLLVGVGEELMFRGVGVHVFARAGFSEAKVALWTSVIFGMAHLTNAINDGSRAILQAIIVSTSGYFLYLCLRVASVILLPMLVHASWDFGLLSGELGSDPALYPASFGILLLQVVLIVVLLFRFRRVDPVPGAAVTGPGAGGSTGG
ncbi:CPBP family intramembrane metalloprotease [Streptomyces sp. SID6648]|nr:CPBP family intramembrane metalloprotease [Streptomyces sp. SID6648]